MVTFGEPLTLARQIMSMADRECIIRLPGINGGLAELWQLTKDCAARGVSVVALISAGVESELRDHHMNDLPQQRITLVPTLSAQRPTITADGRFGLFWVDDTENRAVLIDSQVFAAAISWPFIMQQLDGEMNGHGKKNGSEPSITFEDLMMMRIMASGLKDETGSRIMKTALRSYHRHYRKLAEKLAAKSRAHLGYIARCLLPPMTEAGELD